HSPQSGDWSRLGPDQSFLFLSRTMRESLVPPSQARRAAKRGAPAILSLPGTSLTFLLTGFTWLGISFLLGIALIIGLVYGIPLPRWLKPVRCEGVLAGGLRDSRTAGRL